MSGSQVYKTGLGLVSLGKLAIKHKMCYWRSFKPC